MAAGSVTRLPTARCPELIRGPEGWSRCHKVAGEHEHHVRGVPGIGSPVILGSRGAGQDAGGDALTDTAVQLTYPILPGNGVGVGVGSAGRRDEAGYRAFPQEGGTESVEGG